MGNFGEVFLLWGSLAIAACPNLAFGVVGCGPAVAQKPLSERRLLMVGYGAVAQTTLPLLLEHFDLKENQFTVVDFEDRSQMLAPATAKGLRYVRTQITPSNLDTFLAAHLRPGDILVDLAWNINTWNFLNWCHLHGVHYINTSVEVWDPYREGQDLAQRTLYSRYQELDKLMGGWKKKGPTAVIEHGANPGLISHFTKQALQDISERCLRERCLDGTKLGPLKAALQERRFNEVAMLLGVKVIHCSERDTQVASLPKRVNEFVGTWSPEGLHEEGIAPAEMGWGSHEKNPPRHGFFHAEGPGNQIYLGTRGIDTWVRSWVPNYPIMGMVIRHGEAYSISRHLTVQSGGKVIYRPTVHYAYLPSDATINSLVEMRMSGYQMQPSARVLKNEITEGADILGALVMGHPYHSWWTGSILSIEEARRLAPGQNATTVQVAISIAAALSWMIANPEEGVKVPDDLPHDYVLAIAKPFLGNFVSTASDWTPLSSASDLLVPAPRGDQSDPWQFSNFLVGPQ